MNKLSLITLTISLSCFLHLVTLANDNPLKVFILCGQSNMEGHAKISTFEAMKLDPVTKPIYRQMVDASGSPVMCENVWISYFTGGRDNMGEGYGKLTAGYGSRGVPAERGEKIGPEFTFGIYAQKALKQPILIIKTAWGGKSIHTDFRPPSAGPYVFNEGELENFKRRGKDIKEIKAEKAQQTGKFYGLMMDHVRKVLSDIKRVYPGYNEEKGFELAGFVWFQGWNDMVASGTYPNRGQAGGYDAYTDCLAHFIRDVRKDLDAPKMKFVIGVMGVGGPLEQYASQRYVPIHGAFREAMAAPSLMPEFKGNVFAVRTAKFWDMRLKELEDNQERVKQMAGFLKNKHKEYANRDGSLSASEQKEYVEKYRRKLISTEDEAYAKMARSNGGYHYYGSAKTMAQIGKAFAEATLQMTLP
ncbi:MAG: sialate O-acetylesterase [Opitutales bacterium]